MNWPQDLKINPNLIPSDPRFGSGPSLIPLRRFDALKNTGAHLLGTSHRYDHVKNLVAETIAGLRTFFNVPADYDVVLGNGGATFLFDMLGLTLVKQHATHFTCGEFSQKWFISASKIPWIKTVEKSVPMGQGIMPYDVSESDFIATTLNETSTGVQLDGLPNINPEARARGEKLIAVDATSGAGQIPMEMKNCDVFFFSPQKVLASEGGFWVCFMSPQAVERSKKIQKDQGRYIPEIMRFDYAIDNSRKAQTYNTPSIFTIFLLNEQLKEMNKLGFNEVCAQAKRKADLLYGWAENKSYLTPFIQEKKFRSQAVATIDVDDKIPVDPVVNFLAEKKWVYGIEGYRKLGRNQLRISLFHNISYEDLEKLTQLLSFIFESR